MITQLNIAGNTVHSIKDSVTFPLFDNLIMTGEYVYSKYMNIYENTNFSYFRTPYEMNPKSSGPGYQYEPENKKLKNQYESLVYGFLRSIYEEDYEIRDMWFLYQPNESWISNPPHQHLTADKVSVMYLKVSEGDHIIFYDLDNNSENYYPEVGEILLFDANAIHKPGESAGTERLSVNAEFNKI